MNPISLLNWMLLSTALLGVWWACYRLALRQERSFAYNRAFLVLGPLLAGGLPLLPLAWPIGWGTGPAALPQMAAVLLPAVSVSAAGSGSATGPDWAVWLQMAYVAGVLLALARLTYGLGRLWLAARALSREYYVGYTLTQTHGRLPISSFGRVVFWDETLPLSPAEARQVLRHELAHVRQGHTYDRLLLELLQAALWFNPFVHLCGRALALTHEFLADEAALHTDSIPASYTQLLARQVAGRLGFSAPLAHSFSHSQTLSRIAMIQKTTPIRRWKQGLALPLLGVLFGAVACEKTAPLAVPAASAAPGTAQIEAVAPFSETFAANTEKALQVADVMPEYPGGLEMLMQEVRKNFKFPAGTAMPQGTRQWFVRFTVGSDGVVRGVKVTASPKTKAATPAEEKLGDEAVWLAMQVLKTNWAPGRQHGKPVAVEMVLPIRFEWEGTARVSDGLPLNWQGWVVASSGGGC